jgi:deoxyribodipyrimidine photo-lyase
MLAAAGRIAAPIVAVDGVGLLPLSATPKAHARAVDFRRFLQKTLLPHLDERPQPDPLAGLDLPSFGPEDAPAGLLERWTQADDALLTGSVEALASLPIDHSVGPVEPQGGHAAARARWEAFFERSLPTYGQDRNHPDSDGASGLSPWLHFGHISVFELFADIVSAEDWGPDDTADRVRGQRAGWWGMSAGVESFLDQVLTWRELGHHFAHHTAESHRWETLPEWARKTLEVHAEDARGHVYSLDQLDGAHTHDPVWNAAQRQLVQTGRMHNYLRMLWGKRVLEWLPHPQHALPVLLHLNDKYALDGRDPNSVSGVSWVFGRFDRAWGPERPIFGKIRYMSSENTVRKLKMRRYLARWAD